MASTYWVPLLVIGVPAIVGIILAFLIDPSDLFGPRR